MNNTKQKIEIGLKMGFMAVVFVAIAYFVLYIQDINAQEEQQLGIVQTYVKMVNQSIVEGFLDFTPEPNEEVQQLIQILQENR